MYVEVLCANFTIYYKIIISVFAMLGMLSPSSRGALMTSGIFMYVFMGTIAGYFAARLYKTMKGREWKKSAFLTATLYPGIVFGYCSTKFSDLVKRQLQFQTSAFQNRLLFKFFYMG